MITNVDQDDDVKIHIEYVLTCISMIANVDYDDDVKIR